MSFPYEGPRNALRRRVRPSPHPLECMEDLPMKKTAPIAKPLVRKKLAPTKRKAPVKKPLPIEQPRDRLGRFARKTGQVLWAGAKATGKAIKGTAKAVKSAHKTIKRAQSSARKRAALEYRERKLDLHKREQASGLRRKKVRRKRR